MDRLHKTETPLRPAGTDGQETGRILMFPRRPPRLPVVDWSSAWYHQAAIDETSRPASPKR